MHILHVVAVFLKLKISHISLLMVNFILGQEFGSKNVVRRSFRRVWFRKLPWLYYDHLRDLAFYYTCVHAVKSGAIKNLKISDLGFISRGYNNWKDSTGEKVVLLLMKIVVFTKELLRYCYFTRNY